MRQLSRRNPSEGFTLIEMIVTLAVLAVLLVIGYPALLNSIHRGKVETTLRQAAMEARAARLEAIRRSTRTYLQADFTNNRLVLWRESTPPTPAASPDFSATDDVLVRELPLPEGLHFW